MSIEDLLSVHLARWVGVIDEPVQKCAENKEPRFKVYDDEVTHCLSEMRCPYQYKDDKMRSLCNYVEK